MFCDEFIVNEFWKIVNYKMDLKMIKGETGVFIKQKVNIRKCEENIITLCYSYKDVYLRRQMRKQMRMKTRNRTAVFSLFKIVEEVRK